MALGRLSIGTIPNTFCGTMPQATKAMNATSSISLYISMTIRNTKSKTSHKQDKTKRQKVKGAAKGFYTLIRPHALDMKIAVKQQVPLDTLGIETQDVK